MVVQTMAEIQIGYNVSKGGLGTVTAILILHPILIAQASNSIAKRILLDLKSSLIHSIVGRNKSIIIVLI